MLWVGFMYRDVSQIPDIPLNLGDDTLIVSIDQSTQRAYNYLIGGQWDINRSFAIIAEFGFGEQKCQMLSFTYRF